jgi:hypothetical protein
MPTGISNAEVRAAEAEPGISPFGKLMKNTRHFVVDHFDGCWLKFGAA